VAFSFVCYYITTFLTSSLDYAHKMYVFTEREREREITIDFNMVWWMVIRLVPQRNLSHRMAYNGYLDWQSKGGTAT
jgi:hypothetical protein